MVAGDLVIANSNGTVSKIKNTYSEKSTYLTGGGQGYSNGSNVNFPKICHDSNNNKLYLAFQNTDNNKGMISIGAPTGNETGNNVSWSTPDEFIGNTGEVYGVAWSTTSERGVVVYKAAASSVYCKAFKLDAGETTVTYGAQLTILGGGACDHIDISWDKTADKFLVVIGNNNKFREYVNINPGTEQGGRITRIGDNNLLMVYCHVAHDCMISNNVVLANNVQAVSYTHLTLPTSDLV